MSRNLQIAFTVVALGASGFMAYRWWTKPSAGSQNLTIQIAWICKNADCGVDFSMTTAEVIKKQAPGTSVVPCPKCGGLKTRRAHKCLSCGKNNQSVGHGDAPEICAFCNEPTTGP